jgi:hypothetical protein
MGKQLWLIVSVVFGLGALGLTPVAEPGQISETFDVVANVVIDTYLDDGGTPPLETKNETVQSGASYLWGGCAMPEFGESPEVGITDAMGGIGRSLVLAGPSPFDQKVSYAYTLFSPIDFSTQATLSVTSRSDVVGGSYVVVLKNAAGWYYLLPPVAAGTLFEIDDIVLSGAGAGANTWIEFTGAPACMSALINNDETALKLEGVSEPSPDMSTLQGIGFFQNGAGHIAIDQWLINGTPAPVELLSFGIN